MNKILIITHTEDNFSIEKVTEYIEKNNCEVIRFDVDLYPLHNRLSTVFQDGEWISILDTPDAQYRLDDISAIWYRRAYNIGKGLKEEIDSKFYGAAMGEIRNTLFGFFESVDAYSLGKPSVYRRLDSKEEQLKVAQKIGLTIPDTCLTNNPEEARKFIVKNKNVVAKMQTGFAIYENGVENVVFTNVVHEDKLEELDSLLYCPMQFQRMIEKKRELRITIVGRDVYAFEIDSQQSEDAKIDWRKDGIKLIDKWVRTELPADVEAKLLELLDVYHVDYGAIDMIVSPEDEYYFIEINAAGEFFWLDNLTDGNLISKSIAELLCDKAPRRNNMVMA
ncbi:MvdD family ATP-grasp ribosomal peptide maturase [Chryseobacterium indologenes]|uniref:MvdD family ATP-grasp ribosomal peptide maturase n=1 Tax=Chryseobacterium indologenes TaxID=253 RepID=A0A1Z3W355_CHRID|nr:MULTISPECIES: MvdD family ATP-grasp ribosomal peptide maturase [Chryseobacterium]ASE62209.1 MvdD family ATP-grasp ribosomal peptide maturase [Chryseobacterium indologenes]ATN06046.1 MvdD family ATP-grasp ribosomal peptide maturase [Chryseobacterium indologenes]AYY85193.1 MvdD family ATP-grasp ribosomal peptide maturase [Chryseobacterium indologenes]AZB17923.1 MvdD family ATP-grasp ribosomal peptide maturase [Chryseobacterium indologenes]QIX82087.1 MvdD family ATP-grasp ribosomal peptide mat